MLALVHPWLDPSPAQLCKHNRAARPSRTARPKQERRDGRSLLSREALLTDIERKGLLGLVPPEVKQLFVLLESDFNPLQLCKVVAPLLEKLQALNQAVSGEAAGRGPSGLPLAGAAATRVPLPAGT